MKEIIKKMSWQDLREIAEVIAEIEKKHSKLEMLEKLPEDFYEEVLMVLEKEVAARED